jgi:hypothetical protein
MKKLIFGKGNAKLSKDIATFSLPAGFTCPAAYLCQSWADKNSGKIRDGKATTFRCFAASQEATFPSVRRARWHNFDLLQSCKDSDEMAQLIRDSLPKTQFVRIHVSGDYYSADYLDAWIKVADSMQWITFYSYTKSLHLVKAAKIPVNLRITMSEGGKFDELMANLPYRKAKVIFDPIEAEALEIDHDDYHAYRAEAQDFALLIHGQQPKGSKAAKAIKALKAANVQFSYTNKN